VIDTSGYVPGTVRRSAQALRDSARYLFVSSISVYADFTSGPDESARTAPLDPEHPVDELRADYANYGPLKALCEDEVRTVFERQATIVRPGLIVGPHDPTGRFSYWPHRIARGGNVVVPAPPDGVVQFVDVRDLAGWMLDLCERDREGTFNATGTGTPWRELAETCRTVAGSDATFTWLPGEFLAEQGVGEWMELPLWIHAADMRGLHRADVSRAVEEGLRSRPLEETVAATLADARETEDAGLKPERETALLAAWKEAA
jgi:2'-hydroxyisoflavone reductase